MNKIKHILRPYAKRLPGPLKQFLWNSKELLTYLYALNNEQLYFGTHLCANQLHPRRISDMEQTILRKLEEIKNRPFRLLEVGSWVGQSTFFWAQLLQRKIPDKWEIHCVDAWTSYASTDDLKNESRIKHMDKALHNGRAYKLFLHNLKVSGLSDKIVVHRGRSENILPTLTNNYFDFAYIDGSHYYQDVKSDLAYSTPLLREDGILCGDDLELQSLELGEQIQAEWLKFDYLKHPKTGVYFHPGVSKAIGELMQHPISASSGFWALKKMQSNWVDYLSINK